MMKPENIDDRAFFKGQMDSDSSPELVENGKYTYALNIRPYNTENGSVGVVTNSEGNEEVSYDFDDIGDGVLRVIGSKLDLKRKRVYWFVWGMNDYFDEKAYILYYSYDTRDITTVFSYDNILGFDKSIPIRNINIIYDDTTGDTLKWVEVGEPREINVTAGVNRFGSYTNAESDFSIGDITFANTTTVILGFPYIFFPCECVSPTDDVPTYNYAIGELDQSEWKLMPIGASYPPFLIDTMFYQKTRAPYFSPMSTYNYTEEGDVVSATFLRRKSFQFSYKYVMFDGQQTEWSPVSESVFSQEITSAIVAEGDVLVDVSYPTPKSISIKVPISVYRKAEGSLVDISEFPHSMIARVQIAIRETPTREEPTDWLLLADESVEELYKSGISREPIKDGFPADGESGTYYYNWDSSYKQAPASEEAEVISITFDYDGSQTLTPLDQRDTNTLYYEVFKNPRTQAIAGNRSVFGGGSDGMNISTDVVKSIEDNLSFNLKPYAVDLDISEQTTPLNSWISGATVTDIIDNGRTALIEFDLNEAITISEYEKTFFWDFEINISIGYKLAPILPAITATFNRSISGTSYGIPSEYDDFEDFLTSVLEAEYIIGNAGIDPSGGMRPKSISVDNTSGKMSLEFEIAYLSPIIAISSIDVAFITPSTESFYVKKGYLPYRTFKAFAIEQYGVAFSDNTGRISPTITGDFGRIEAPHFYNEDYNPQAFRALVSGVDDISVPDDARVMHLVRKRSESYSDFIHFAISKTNCPTESWNSSIQYNIGYVNLDLDQPQALSDNNKYFYVTLNSVNGGINGAYESKFRASVLNFLPQQGDVFRFLYKQDVDGVIEDIYSSSFNILGYNENFNTIIVDWDDIISYEPYLANFLQENLDELGEGSQVRICCEIEKKSESISQEFYWEVAAQYSCTNGSVDVSDSKADNMYLYGDVYMKIRGYCVDYLPDNAENSYYYNFVLQDRNYNDFAKTASCGEGRPNAVIKGLKRGDNVYSEVNRDNLIKYSDKSIQNTDVKKYSSIYPEGIQEVDNVFGRIENLVGGGDVLNIYQEDKISKTYVDRTITTDVAGEVSIIADKSVVLSDVVYNDSDYGMSQDNTSFAQSGYRKYFTDSKRGNVYRQSMDGITVISEIGMSGYFKDVFRKLRNSFIPPIIRGVVDDRVDEYVLSLSYSEPVSVSVFDASPLYFSFTIPESASYFNVFSDDDVVLVDTTPSDKYSPTEYFVYGNQDGQTVTVTQKPSGNSPEDGDIVEVSIMKTETLVFSERTGGWTTFLSYDSEWLNSGIQSYHSFVNGQMWIHDIGNTDYNTFHGRTFPSEITTVGNKSPQLTKFWKTIAAKTKFQNISVEEGDIETAMEQESHIPRAVFENREDSQWACFLKEGAGEEVLDGDKLRGRWISVKLTLNKPDVNIDNLKLFSVLMTSGSSDLTM